MINTEIARLEGIAIHRTGNKDKEEGMQLSKAPAEVDNETTAVLQKFFLGSFEKTNEYFHFTHPSGVHSNELYTFCSAIFHDPAFLFEQSVNIAKLLYEKSVHPKIKTGELYVVYFRECVVDGQALDAIGIFRSETKETYLDVKVRKEKIDVESREGVSIHKPDKGCLIFNTDTDKGFLVAVLDGGKGTETFFWKEEFLQLKPREDDFFHTRNIMGMCKEFVMNELPEKFELTKAEQVDLLNKSVDFFKKNEEFKMDDFADEIFPSAEVKETFKNYKQNYASEQNLDMADEFSISEGAVKKQARVFKSVIKLDKNFHIYVHGNREFIVKGFDPESGLSYYQLFFKEEV